MLRRKRRRVAALASALVLAALSIGPQGASAQTGTVLTKTLTFSEAAAADFTLQIRGPMESGTRTVLSVELGADGTATPLPAAALASVNFSLAKLGVSGGLAFAANANVSSTTFPDKIVSFAPNSANPRLFSIVILHAGGLGAADTENWTLSIHGLPTGGTPPPRAIAFIEQGQFVALNPLAPSVGLPNILADIATSETDKRIVFTATVENQQPGKTYTHAWTAEDAATLGTVEKTDGTTLFFEKPEVLACGPHPVTFRFDVKDAAGVVVTSNRKTVVIEGPPCLDVEYPWFRFEYAQVVPRRALCPGCPPEPACPTCPAAWQAPAESGAERTAVVFSPVDHSGRLLGPGRAEAIRIEVKGGTAIGPVHDSGTGAYTQLIEHPAGAAALVRFAVDDVRRAEIEVGLRPDRQARMYRNMAIAVGVALALCVIGGAALFVVRARRRGPA